MTADVDTTRSRPRTPAQLLKETKHVAMERGGKCTTRKIRSSKDPVSLVCGKGHKWQALVHDVIGSRKTWCRRCSYDQMANSFRLDLDRIRGYAAEQGGKCLSSSYKNAKQKLKLQCSEGHRWEATWSNLSKGQWCPTCRRAEAAASRRLGIAAARALAKTRRGKCLSDEYINNRTPLTWRCNKNHEWTVSFEGVKAGSWCPECARIKLSRARSGKPPPLRRKIEIADLRAYARKHRGKCRTDFYVNQRQVFDWECRRGHRFRASWVNIQDRENFCRKCGEDSRKQQMLKRAHKFARAAGGRCLSSEYKNATSPLKWRCRAGHRFSDSWVTVNKRKCFCARCEKL